MSKLLFILKRREDYSAPTHATIGLSTGLYNSAKFMVDMMNDMNIESVIEVAIDNNCIDRLVTQHKPTHVIVEALWVVPSKFSVLTKLHPNVKWIIRLHSEMPFMSGEGMAMDWIGDYSDFENIILGINAPRMLKEISLYLQTRNSWSDEETKKKVIYLPNFYPQDYVYKSFNKDKEHIDVACFGAIRPLKNQLLQAYAAIDFANKIGKKLKFHINAGRIEMNGNPVIHNLKGLFQQIHQTGHELINHVWTPREDFLMTCASMDIGMQCNFSETFNIVSADLISQGVPIVGSSEIPWASFIYNADPNSSTSMTNALIRTYYTPQLNVAINQFKLKLYTNNTKKIWYKYFF
jgi:hypothetical protein